MEMNAPVKKKQSWKMNTSTDSYIKHNIVVCQSA